MTLPGNAPPAVQLEGVTRAFGKHRAVDQLDLAVPAGAIYGFIGPNGSGKTTTLRMVMNILTPDQGEIRVFGEPLHPRLTDRIGYLPEERGLYRQMKVREVLRFYGALKAGRSVHAAVDHWLRRLELADWADKKVAALSKGMSQKVQFIAAVVAEPELLILDEPFSGLDPVNAQLLIEVVLEVRARGTTVLFSTHDMVTAEKLCDALCMIFRGRKVLDGTLDAIQARYGQDTIRVRLSDGAADLSGLPGVTRFIDRGHERELTMAAGTDPQQVLAALVTRHRVESFAVVRPSLHDIFLRIAGPASTEEATHA